MQRLTLLLAAAVVSVAAVTYNCDDDAIRDTTARVSSLTPNQFHKICPSTHTIAPFGKPGCGDGSNFAFFFSRPPQKLSNDQKILIEFQGGGACWDSETCAMQSSYLAFPETLNDFVGLSCTEINAAITMSDGGGSNFPISMLCAKDVGGVDFREYNTVVVPYCTQDVFLGSNTMNYDDGSTIRHVGAHNMMGVLRWIYSNFPSPSHIALTGCSAGATALPIAYDLLNKHYNSVFKLGVRSVHINVVSDSPVYLTPQYFLNNGLDNWNPAPMMKRLRFALSKYRQSEDYPTKLWNHILRRGSNRDRWGFVSHTDDPISQMYYEYMSGGGERDDDGGGYGNGNWWSELTSSVATVQSKHKNVEKYYIDGEGHCSFGLYYPLQIDGFEDWAGAVYQESPVLGKRRPSVLIFLSALLLGGAMGGGVMLASRKRKPIELDDVVLINDTMQVHQRKCLSWVVPFLNRFKDYPLSASYFVTITVYFVSMLLWGGFTHPLNNPSLGPSAETLSKFGINNPTLVVYNYQHWRLTTSIFVCSGILTYLIVALCLWRHTRHIEARVNNSGIFFLAAFCVWIGSNLFYACVANGASCASVGLVLGLNAFSIVVGKKNNDDEQNGFPMPIASTVVLLILTCVLFPFNSWILLLSAIFAGAVVVPLLFSFGIDASDDSNEFDTEEKHEHKKVDLRWGTMKAVAAVYAVMYLVLLFGLSHKNEIYKYPYLTGCEPIYSTEVSSFVDSYYDNANARELGEEGSADEDGESMCAQMCVPHIAYRPVLWGVNKFSSFTIQHGMCEENGYEEHVADKTFTEFSVTLDVELYYQSYDDE